MTAAALILAAGSSSRMGQSKQMLEVDGEKILVKTIKTVLKSGITNVSVVLGFDQPAHRKVIEALPVDIIYNPEWAKGMGSSIKKGVAHLTRMHPVPDAIIILVCDQPLLRAEHIRNLLQQYHEAGKPVVASRYSNMPGVPALFNNTYYERLLAIPDDHGAKKILLKNQQDVSETDFPEGEIDLDTPDDYDAFRLGRGAGG